MEGLKTDSLRVDCLTEKPQDYDWSRGYGEAWEIIQPYDLDAFSEEDEEKNNEKTGYYNIENMEESNQPMMNYYYPLPNRYDLDEDDAKKLSHLPLCLIKFEEWDEDTHQYYDTRYALALTGGGMDLSWQICEAYIRLGYYPPIHFRLPNMAGKSASETNLGIVDACIKGREILKNWQDNDIEDLKRTREYLK